MLRRDILGIAVATPIASLPMIKPPKVSSLISEIEKAAKEEIHGVTRVQVVYDPEDKKVPLMILAFRGL